VRVGAGLAAGFVLCAALPVRAQAQAPSPDGAPPQDSAGAKPSAGPQAVAPAESLRIQHEPLRCLLAGRFPVIDACFEPAARVAQARVYFQADDLEKWHWVDLQPLGPCRRAILPRPEPEAHRVRYVIAATDVDARNAGTPEEVVEVVTAEADCGERPLAPFLSDAAVVVGGGGHPEYFMRGGASGGLGGPALAAIVGGGVALATAAVLLAGGSEPEPAETPSARGAAVVWTSELAIAGGRGQLVADGTEGRLAPGGRADVVLAPRPGTTSVEATILDAAGTPGSWRFTLASGAIRPGSLRALAGEVAALGPDSIVFRLRGRRGERVAFRYEVP
jgi:hypothetical protein